MPARPPRLTNLAVALVTLKRRYASCAWPTYEMTVSLEMPYPMSFRALWGVENETSVRTVSATFFTSVRSASTLRTLWRAAMSPRSTFWHTFSTYSR